jgi:hypothetical protein
MLGAKRGGVGIGNPNNNIREILRIENIRGARQKMNNNQFKHWGKDTIHNQQ